MLILGLGALLNLLVRSVGVRIEAEGPASSCLGRPSLLAHCDGAPAPAGVLQAGEGGSAYGRRAREDRSVELHESASGQLAASIDFIAHYGDEERLSAASIRSSRLST